MSTQPEPDNRRFEIDRRPITVVLLARIWKQLLLLGLIGLLVVLLQLTAPTGLSPQGYKALIIFAFCAILWATSLLPLAITSLFAMALLPLAGVMSAQETYSYFGSRVVFFLMGALMLSAAMIATGISKRFATVVVRRFGATPGRLVTSVFLLCAFGSSMMSAHAVGVMVLPIVVDITRALGLRPLRSNLGKALCFSLAWGCVIGGSLTVLGGARGPLAIGIVEEFSGGAQTIGFVQYMLYGLPMVVGMLLVTLFTLKVVFPPEISDTRGALKVLESNLEQMGKVTARELVVGVIMVATVLMWAFAGDTLGLDTIAIIAMSALFLLRAVTWREVQEEVNWGLILMYGGAICLSAAMAHTGAALWLTELVFADGVSSPQMLLIVIALASALLTEFMSNSAVVAMLLPPTLSLAQANGIDLAAAAMTVVLPSNFAFMFPISTPVTALAWSVGFYTPRQVAVTGAALHAVGFGFMVILITLYWPAVGLI